MSEKTYTEAEVAALLGQAVHLQNARGTDPNAPTLTLAEVKAAAAEAGIDARFVELAASAGKVQQQTYAGLPVARERSITVEQVLTDATWDKMVGVFVHTFGGPGEVSLQGGQRRWHRAGVTMTADALGEQTVVHAEARHSAEMPLAVLMVASAAAIMVSMVAVASLEWTVGMAAVLLIALVAGGYSRARKGAGQRLAEQDEQMQAALNQCAALLLESLPGRPRETESPGADAARLDPGVLSDEDKAPSTSSPDQRRRQRS